MKKTLCLALALCLPDSIHFAFAHSTSDGVVFAPPSGEQTESDEYTRYELLEPGSASFKIYYEVTATSAGAKVFYNPIRRGSVASDESVLDAMSGLPLHFDVVSGAEARKDPLMPKASPDMDYIRVTLARPVPEHGQGRVVIIKTYKDPKSYFVDGQIIVFNRALGIKRNKIILPAGYELVGCTVPSQIRTEADGRLSVSFMHAGTGEAPLELRAVKDARTGAAALPHQLSDQRSWEAPFAGETERSRLSERAHMDRDIVYFLQQPETHTFKLYHDYTETRTGVSSYVNVVRNGSRVADPSAYVLDTGEVLKTRIMTGAEIRAAKIDAGDPVDAKGQAVVIPFRPVLAGQTLRLRITESYTAPASYRMDGDELVFDRSLERPRNAVVLPSGWYCTESAAPATVQQLPDGRIQLDFWDDRPDPVGVLVKAKRRLGTSAGGAITSAPARP